MLTIRHKRVRNTTKEIYWKKIQKIKSLPANMTKTKWDKLKKLIWEDKGFWDLIIKNKLNLVKMIPIIEELLEIKE